MHAPICLAILMYLYILSLQSYFTRSLLICPKCTNYPSVCQVTVHDYFFLNAQKSNLSHPNATFNAMIIKTVLYNTRNICQFIHQTDQKVENKGTMQFITEQSIKEIQTKSKEIVEEMGTQI